MSSTIPARPLTKSVSIALAPSQSDGVAPSRKSVNSATTANPVSRLFGLYMNPVIRQITNGTFTENDLAQDDSVLTSGVFAAFEKNWATELTLLPPRPPSPSSPTVVVDSADEASGGTTAARSPPSKKSPSLLRALRRTFWRGLLFAAVLKLCWGALVLLSISFFVRRILSYINFRFGDAEHTPEEASTGYILAIFFFVCTVLLSICLQHMNASSAVVGLRVKAAVSTAVYRKVFAQDQHQSKMDVVSLVSTDCTKLADSCTTLQFLWSGVAESLAIVGVLLGLVGKAALPGLGLMLLLVPVQYAIGMAIARMRKKVVQASDDRVHMMEEILTAIKLVKMYAWEMKFSESVGELRALETKLAQVGSWLKSINLALVFALPPLIALAIFGIFAIEKPLEATLAFTTLSMFNTLRLPLVQLPKGLRAYAEASAAIERLQAFLLSPDRENRPPSLKPEVTFHKANFAYGSDTTPLLRDISCNICPGELVMIAGPVGSGKSNFLQAVLGQMKCLSGTESVGGNFAYVPQSPWCAHGTVRDNIIFGRPWDELKYRRVLFACALERDLQLLEYGDLTEIGERGMNLSGGQKQRIALARAAYSCPNTGFGSGENTLFLLDSPLSAVDMYTGTHIFKYCIQNLMVASGAAVILITHQVQLFREAHTVMVMDQGQQLYCGPFQESVIRKHFPYASAITETDAEIVAAIEHEQQMQQHGALMQSPLKLHEHSDQEDLPNARESLVPRGISIGSDGGAGNTPALDAGIMGIQRSSSIRSTQSRLSQQSRLSGGRARSASGASHGRASIVSRPRGLSGANRQVNDALNPAGDLAERAMSLRAEMIRAASGSHDIKDAASRPYLLTLPQEDDDRAVLTAAIPRSFSDGTGKESGGDKTSRISRTTSITAADSPARLVQPSPATNAGGFRPHARSMRPSAMSFSLPESSASIVLAEDISSLSKTFRPAPKETHINGYNAFFHAVRWYLAIPSIIIFAITQITRIFSDIWISLWVGKRYAGRPQSWYTGVYGGYVAVFLTLLLIRGFFYYKIGLNAASRMHNKMFAQVLRAPMAFFTTTPLGKVLSVFSRDQDLIDEALLDNTHMVIIYAAILGTTIGVVIRVIPVFAAIAGGLLLVSLFFFRYYIAASRTLKELSGTSSASVVSQVSETLQGLPVIKAYRAEARFQQKNSATLDRAQLSSYNLEMLQLWLATRLDILGCLLVLTTCLLSIGLDKIPASQAGLAVSNSFQILLFFSLMVRGAADIHANISSVERVVKLGDTEKETDFPLSHESCPPDHWPSRGEIDFHGVVMSYMPTSPHVLKGVNFSIRSGEKIGVVGRTGAGKSSLIMCLFRLAELAEGSVRIDGVDIKRLNLTELRRRIAIIPQEPVMFRGTIRSNLDPFSEHSDEALHRALERCLLGNLIRESPLGLQTPVAHMGSNFSLGQQQLLCLCRSMLNGSKLLALDEATASLDAGTDAAVQRVLRTEFADRTIITIAHRLDTIIDSDRILVMDAGRVAEFDTPYSLLAHPDSIFSQLCRQTGAQYESLRAAAERHHDAMHALVAQLVQQDEIRIDYPTVEEEDEDDLLDDLSDGRTQNEIHLSMH